MNRAQKPPCDSQNIAPLLVSTSTFGSENKSQNLVLLKKSPRLCPLSSQNSLHSVCWRPLGGSKSSILCPYLCLSPFAPTEIWFSPEGTVSLKTSELEAAVYYSWSLWAWRQSSVLLASHLCSQATHPPISLKTPALKLMSSEYTTCYPLLQ